MMRHLKFALVLGLVGSLFMGDLARGADPRKAGPYRVGVRTEVFVDEGRTCAVTGQPRTLVTEIWYPATADAKRKPLNTFSDYFVRQAGVQAAAMAMAAFGGNFEEVAKNFKNSAHRGADIRKGEFPLLIFSHGNGGFRHQNTFQCEYLASHGYVVAAPDHTGNAGITVLPESVVPYQSATRGDERRDDRPKDASFLITHLWKLSGEKGHWLSGRLTKEQVGVLGHSFGGFTSCRISELDDRVKAIMPMTLAITSRDPEEVKMCKIPAMVILGDADRTVGPMGNMASTNWYKTAGGPKYLLNFKGAVHFTFTEMPQINPNFGDGIGVEKDDEGKVKFEFSDPFEAQRITNEYSVAFFDTFVKGDKSAKAFVDKNHYPEVVAYQNGEMKTD
jgi:predicted dienelactone hydrolase